MNFTQFSFGLAIVISAGLATQSSPALAHNHKSDAKMPEIGLQMYSLRKQLDEDTAKAVKQVHDWQIEVVEGGGNLHGNNIEAFKAMLDENGISVVSVDTSIDEIRDNPMGAAYKAHFYGAKYATIYWVPHNGEVGFTIDDAKAAVKVLNEGGKVLKEQGITLQYHPHGYEFLPHEDGTMLDYMMQNTTDAKFQMDVFWIKQGGADPVALLQKYPNRFTSLHLKDRLKGTENSTNGQADVEANVVLGTGDVGIAAVIKEAKKQGIQYYFIEDESSRVLQQIPKSMAFIEPLLK